MAAGAADASTVFSGQGEYSARIKKVSQISAKIRKSIPFFFWPKKMTRTRPNDPRLVC